MGHLYVKKDNGLYSVWSTIVDDWLAEDLTLQELKHYDMVTGIKDAIKQSKAFFEPGSLERHMERHGRTYDGLEELRKLNHPRKSR